MFCSGCGCNLKDDCKFCNSCGKSVITRVKGNASASTSGASSSTEDSTKAMVQKKRPLSFSDFYQEKSKQRMNKSAKRKDQKEPEDVLINIGVMKHTNGEVKPLRGKSLPLKIKNNSDYDSVLQSALKKRMAYDRSFNNSMQWILVYQDGRLARTLPGLEEMFTLQKYKEDCGKTYARITLYLCPVSATEHESSQEVNKSPLHEEDNSNALFNCDHDYGDFCEDVDDMNSDEVLTIIKELFPDKPEDVIVPMIEQAHGDPNIVANILSDNCHHNNILSPSLLPCGNHYPAQDLPLTGPNNGSCPPTFSSHSNRDTIQPNTMPPPTQPQSKQEDFNSLGEFLQSNRSKFNDSSVRNRLRLKIRRRKIWSDVMEKLTLFNSDCHSKEALDLCLQLDIKFIGEEAIDQGGVSREFFSCVFVAGTQKIMIGNSENNYYTFIHDSTALEHRHYYFYGVLLGLALLHGCPGPHNWCPSLSQYVLNQECTFSPCQVPDFDVRHKLTALSECTSVEEMASIIAEFPERFDAGYNKGNISFQDRDDIIKKVTRHYVISACHEEIQQVVAGLDNVGILKWLLQFPDAAMKELLPSLDLTSETIVQFLNVVYSPEGSNHKVKEEDIVYNFSNFLELVEQGKVSGTQMLNLNTDQSEMVKISLNDVLQFITGARYFCVALQKGQIEFDHEAPEGKRLEVSTCSFRLSIPSNKRYTESAAVFAQNITEDIICSPGFGKV